MNEAASCSEKQEGDGDPTGVEVLIEKVSDAQADEGSSRDREGELEDGFGLDVVVGFAGLLVGIVGHRSTITPRAVDRVDILNRRVALSGAKAPFLSTEFGGTKALPYQ